MFGPRVTGVTWSNQECVVVDTVLASIHADRDRHQEAEIGQQSSGELLGK